MRQRALIVPVLSLALIAVACGDDSDSSASGGGSDGPTVVAGEAVPVDRCEAYKAAGTI